MSPLQYQTKNAWLLGIVGFVTVVIGLAAWLFIGQLQDVNEAVNRGRLIRQHCGQALSSLMACESATRAYLLTADKSYLSRYRQDADTVLSELKNVRWSTTKASIKNQQSQLLDLAAERLTAMEEVLKHYKPPVSALNAVDLNKGQQIMARFRAVAEETLAEEDRIVEARLARAQTFQSLVYILVAALTSILLAGLVYIYRLGRGYTESQTRAKADLEKLVGERTAELASVNTTLSSTVDEFRTLADAVPLIVWTSRPDGSIDYGNKRWYQYSGYEYVQGKDIDWLPWLHPDDVEKTMTDWTHALANGIPYETEYRLRHSSGDYRWFLCRATPIFDRDGKLIHYYGTSTDIHENKNAMEQLSEGERIARSLFDLMPQMGWTAKPDGVVDFYNRRWYEYFNRTWEDMQKLGTDDLHHPDFMFRARELWRYCIESGNSYEMKFPLKGKDGNYRWFRTRVNPVLDSNGVIVRWVGINTDVDEEERLARTLEQTVDDRTSALRDSELRFQSIFNNAFQFTGLLSPNGEILEVNQTALDFINLEQAQVVGKKFWELDLWLSAGLQEQLKDAVQTAAKGKFIRREIEIESYGTTITCDFSLKPIWDDGKVVLLLPEGRDITELRNARDEAISASELKSQFVGNISHEIRTPMSAILGLTELLVSETSGDIKDTAQHILTSGKSLMAIVNDLLDFSKLESGKFTIDKTPFVIADSLRDVITSLVEDCDGKELKFSTYIDGALPQTLTGDRQQVERVLRHLVQNAIKFTNKGTVDITATPANRVNNVFFVKFAVTDSGIGISEESQKLLFKPFVQADGSTTRKYGGSGIGLVLSQRIIDLLGGAIGVESIEGKGSTFWFTVPLESESKL